MLSALILNQLSFPAVPMLYIYLSERNIPMYKNTDIYKQARIYLIFGHIDNR
jgi:hypothetical protein